MPRVRQALRFALDPTVVQRRACARHAGAARNAYNWGLERVQETLRARTAFTVLARHPGGPPG